MGGYLKRIGRVKYSHSWPVKGLPPRNPDEDAHCEKKVILQQSVVVFFMILPSFSHLTDGASHPLDLSLAHWGGVSPTISMPCCWSWARSSAFLFLSSSI